ncbi:MAG: hypothetical protein H7343_22575 [Undibacterium sp.]|nr:hypothetical protein [Opitutaceae bacterium]
MPPPKIIFFPANRLPVLLLALCVGALLVMMHVFALPLLPMTGRTLPVAAMRPEPGLGPHVYSIFFPDSDDDAPNDPRSRVELYEDGKPLNPHADLATVNGYGRGNYAHLGGRLIFSAIDNGDPRKNGCDYDAYHPLCSHRALGYAATLLSPPARSPSIVFPAHPAYPPPPQPL